MASECAAGDVTTYGQTRSSHDFGNDCLNTFGSYGDIHPYLAIAAELCSRGHHPVVATSELYREKLVAGGFDFVRCGPTFRRRRNRIRR